MSNCNYNEDGICHDCGECNPRGYEEDYDCLNPEQNTYLLRCDDLEKTVLARIKGEE